MKTVPCRWVIGFVILALAVASGCAKRQLTRGETSRLDAIEAKIAEAERIGAPDCVPPKELARAKAALERARQELLKSAKIAEPAVREAEAAAEDLLAKTKDCLDAKKPAPAPAPAPAPSPEPAPPPAPVEPPPAPAVPAPTAPPPAPAPMVEEPSGLEPVYFDFDKSFIRKDARPALQKAAEYMKKNPDVKIRIEGNCDERGTSEYNMALGDRRAISAKKYLTALGIDANRLSTVSYGKERPTCTEHNEECWQKNRRVDFLLQK